MVFYLFFSYTAFTSGGKARWKNISTTSKFLLRISQNHSPNRACPPSKISHCSSVTRIRHPRRLFIAKGKFLRVLMRRVFFNRRQILPSIRGTSHSRSDCIFKTIICVIVRSQRIVHPITNSASLGQCQFDRERSS